MFVGSSDSRTGRRSSNCLARNILNKDDNQTGVRRTYTDSTATILSASEKRVFGLLSWIDEDGVHV